MCVGFAGYADQSLVAPWQGVQQNYQGMWNANAAAFGGPWTGQMPGQVAPPPNMPPPPMMPHGPMHSMTNPPQ